MPRRMTIEKAKKYTEENSSSVLLDTEWVSSTTPMRFRCSCGNEFTATWNKFQAQNKRRCGVCAKKEQYNEKRASFDQVKRALSKAGCEYVSGEYVNQKSKLAVRCSCGKVFNVTYEAVASGRSGLCPDCMKKLQAAKQAYTTTEVAVIAWAYGAELLTEKYENARQELRFRCRCGREFTTNLNRFLTLGKTRCDVCAGVESRGEEKIRKWLEAKGIKYESQKRFIDCRGHRPYPFDFYLPDHNVCIEYDGIQHFESRAFGGKDLELIHARDEVKTKYCEANGLELIRISYKDFDRVNEILDTLIPR